MFPRLLVLVVVAVAGCSAAPSGPAQPGSTDKTTVTVVPPAAGEQSVATEPEHPPVVAAPAVAKPVAAAGSDRDGDGIADADDRCPDEPEDRDGFEDSDGCPDPDNDRDGILDAQDKCPNAPETKNGFQDDDGCPDTKP